MTEKVEKEFEEIIDRLRNLIPCFLGDPCDYDHTCENHQIIWKILDAHSRRKQINCQDALGRDFGVGSMVWYGEH